MDRVMGHHSPHSPVTVEMLPLEPRFRQTVRTCIPTLSAAQMPRTNPRCPQRRLGRTAGRIQSMGLCLGTGGSFKKPEMGLTTHMHISIRLARAGPWPSITGTPKLFGSCPNLSCWVLLMP